MEEEQTQEDLLLQLSAITKKMVEYEAVCEDLFNYLHIPMDYSDGSLANLRLVLKQHFAKNYSISKLNFAIENDFKELRRSLNNLIVTLKDINNFEFTFTAANKQEQLVNTFEDLLKRRVALINMQQFKKECFDQNTLFLVKGKYFEGAINSFIELAAGYKVFSVNIRGIRDIFDEKDVLFSELTTVEISNQKDSVKLFTFIEEELQYYQNFGIIREQDNQNSALLCGQMDEILGKVHMDFNSVFFVSV